MKCRCKRDKVPHVVDTDGSTQLFTDRADFCRHLYHMRPCHEWGVTEECIGDGNDRTSCAIVYYEERIVRFRSCTRGDTRVNLHPEDFIVERFADAREGTMELYIKFQPCHESAGPRKVRHHPKSCTRTLITFLDERPRLHLVIHCANVYRAHYVDPSKFNNACDAAAFEGRIRSAIEGVRLLTAHPRITVTGMDADAWHRIMWRESYLEQRHELIERRAELDARVTKFFAESTE